MFVERQCHSSVVAELLSSHGLWEWLRAHRWLWVICNETKDPASWRPTNDDHTGDNEGSTRLWRENLMVCIWRCNRWLVWHHRAGIREMGSSIEKQIGRRSSCLQEVTWPRWIETATRTRSRLLQEDVETTLCERSSDSVPVSIHEIYEEQSWKWRPDEVDDKISDWWKKTGRIMDGSFARIRSDVSSYSSWSCCSKTKA